MEAAMNIKDYPKEEKPREKLMMRGPEHLSNQELLAILIGSGTREKSALSVAEEMLAMDKGGLEHLRDCTVEELSLVRGIGAAKACHVVAAFELGRRVRFSSGAVKEQLSILNCSDIADIFMSELQDSKKEHFKTVLLDSQSKVISIETAAIGDLNTAIVNPREVFKSAVKKSAASAAFVHNHPSGDPTPSMEDINITRRLIECGNLLGIRVVDHLVIGSGKYISMRQEGYFLDFLEGV